MLKVNLLRNLGSTAAPGAGTMVGVSGGGIVSQDLQKQALYRILVMAAFVGLVIAYENLHLSTKQNRVDEMRAQVQSVLSEKAKYGDAGPIVEQYSDQKKKLDEQIKILERLTENRLREVQVLDAIQSAMPAQAWLDRIVMENGKTVVTGFATDESGVSELYRAFEENPLISQVRVTNEAQDLADAGAVQKFEFSFQAGKAR